MVKLSLETDCLMCLMSAPFEFEILVYNKQYNNLSPTDGNLSQCQEALTRKVIAGSTDKQ